MEHDNATTDPAERLAAAMLALRIVRSMEEAREIALQLIMDCKASPLNPHGDNIGPLVDDLIESIELIKSETWAQVRRMLVRGTIKGI